ncbi:MAG TPA: CHAP domain-containing protein [Gammaproteobacteria bacterium]|nr:CHAP domain-containing protein [Gammaproteobacteria bacterium]
MHRSIWSSTTLLLTVLLMPALNSALAASTNDDMPDACRSGCISPYGSVLGESPRGIEAYSNCQSGCVIFEPNRWKGTYTGIKWQCVEYARRWLLVNAGAVYGDVDIAADIWDRIDHLTDVKTGRLIPLQSHANGSTQAPAVGDLLIYAKAFQGTGHVAVVTGVDASTSEIEVSEQNFNNDSWPADYARKFSFIRQGEHYWLLDSYILGWKHADIQWAMRKVQ